MLKRVAIISKPAWKARGLNFMRSNLTLHQAGFYTCFVDNDDCIFGVYILKWFES